MDQSPLNRQQGNNQQGNRRVVLYSVLFVSFMIGMSFASVPLYRLFCQVTGFGGTPQAVAAVPQFAEGRAPYPLRLSFNADTNSRLNWEFAPKQKKMDVLAGEVFLAYYEAHNTSDQPLTGTATFNVTPLKAGKYFKKIECFCFTEQPLNPGETAEFPVSFFIDAAIADDPLMRDVTDITLSYTFFPKMN